MLSNTMGVDFGPYLTTIVLKIRKNWYVLIPESARPPMMKEGYVGIEFTIRKNGSVTNQKLSYGSGDKQLDRAAWGAVREDRLPALPSEFKGDNIILRLHFAYNSKFQISPAGPTKIQAGSTQQFSVPATGAAHVNVSWSISGNACGTSGCGTVSNTGLYAGPTNVSEATSLTLRAEQTSAPYQVACTTVTVVPGAP